MLTLGRMSSTNSSAFMKIQKRMLWNKVSSEEILPQSTDSDAQIEKLQMMSIGAVYIPRYPCS